MKIDEARKLVEKKMHELEEQVFVVETIMIPRYEKDREILKKMKEAHGRLVEMERRLKEVIAAKKAGKELYPEQELTDEEIKSALPETLR